MISMMVGAVAVREVPDERFDILESNSTNSTEIRDNLRVQVAVTLALLSGIIQVRCSLPEEASLEEAARLLVI